MTVGHEFPRPDMSASWRTDAACLGMDPNLFFPETGQTELARQAKAICDQCPVRTDCLEDALANFDTFHDFGIRGGLSERTRRALRVQRSRNAA